MQQLQQQQQQQQQRPQPQLPGNMQQNQDHVQQSLDDGFFGSVTSNGMDDYRRAQNGVGQLSSSNTQPGSVEEFPPLGRGMNGEIGGDRRLSMMQAVAGGFGVGATAGGVAVSGFPPGMGPTRSAQEVLRVCYSLLTMIFELD